jgi:hypothetical protein
MILILLSIEECVFSGRFGATVLPSGLLHSHKIYLTVIREPTLYKILKFHNPNLISIFYRSDCLFKESNQVWGSIEIVVTNLFIMVKGC